MAYSQNKKLEKVYRAKTDEQTRAAYNEWATDYDQDISAFGIRLPFVAAAVFARYVPQDAGLYLDAGCGTGMHVEPLFYAGYSDFIGIDVSDGMIEQARQKGIYASLEKMSLGKTLEFENDKFEASYCIGVLAAGHAPAKTFNELVRVTKPGGYCVFSIHAHDDPKAKPYHDYREKLLNEGKWELVDKTEPFVSMPKGDQNIQHAIYVYQVK